ncbi:MAG: pyridoxal-dependent decarboxylase [Gordonia sp. (in: high G+C Gram-positive bacteria)]
MTIDPDGVTADGGTSADDDRITAETALIADADLRAQRWLKGIGTRPVFPAEESVDALRALDSPLSDNGEPAAETIRLLDEVAGAATVASNDPRYFGFVIGASLPVAAAADRIVLAWDQCASSFDNSPAAHLLEQQAARLVLDALDLPHEAAVGFSTSATAGTLSALVAARRTLLRRAGWDIDRDGLDGAPRIRVVVSQLAHITVLKAIRLLGFGLDRIERVPTDEFGRIVADRLPALDARTILILQAGEVNTGESDPFDRLIPQAHRAGAWVHVDGAFGLWAQASRAHRHLIRGVELADSWTTDAHKWLNVPYDSAIHIVREAAALSDALTADAVYSAATADAQKNLTLEFSRRPRGIAVWAALRTLGRDGIEEIIDGTVTLAQRTADGLRAAGFTIVNRVVLNQVLVRAATPEITARVRELAVSSGQTWFGVTRWNDDLAFRISVSSWRTQEHHIDALVGLLRQLHTQVGASATAAVAPEVRDGPLGAH